MGVRVRGELFWVAGAVLLGLVLSLICFATDPIRTSPDSYEYMRGGLTLWNGQGFKSMSGNDQLVFPPFYPLFIGAANAVLHDPLFSARLVSLLSSVIGILLLYFVARALCPGMPAVLAAWLYAILPLRIWLSSMAWSESLFAALTLIAALLWITSDTRPVRGLICGITLGAAYLTRPEGFLVFAVLVVASAARWWSEQRRPRVILRGVAPALVGFAVMASPYILYLRGHTGQWQLTGKANINLAISSQRTAEVPVERLRVLSSDDRRTVPARQGTDLRSVVRRTSRNARTELRTLTEFLSPFLLVAIGIGLTTAWWRQRGAQTWIVLIALASPSLVVPFFFVQERMLLMATVAGILLAAPAIQCSATGPSERQTRSVCVLAGMLMVCAAAWMTASSPIRQLAGGGLVARHNALLAALRRESDARGPILGNGKLGYMLAFNTGRDFLFLPWEPLDRVLHYAQSRHASFLVVQTTDHPDLAAIARHPVSTRALRPLARFRMTSENGVVVTQLYRVHAASEADDRGGHASALTGTRGVR